eukprot:CAMPEP_0119307266 /NCGR_PEP_ID=MMETSP1333-20130426/7812_1 /TAXON_ID=418940 /ORGANISM="Scyphosphaera apsteinii, Strain RCC1455" /LENGTH=88 /DNA_ID=CAMNT_0007310769 /DNA_START=471 /DNA_END=737 /DNA_ORIENTATION=-
MLCARLSFTGDDTASETESSTLVLNTIGRQRLWDCMYRGSVLPATRVSDCSRLESSDRDLVRLGGADVTRSGLSFFASVASADFGRPL